MRLSQLPIKIFVVLTSILFVSEPVRSQSGNMSDITLPSPDAIISEPPTQETPITEGETELPTEEAISPDDNTVEEVMGDDFVFEEDNTSDEAQEFLENASDPTQDSNFGENTIEDLVDASDDDTAPDLTDETSDNSLDSDLESADSSESDIEPLESEIAEEDLLELERELPVEADSETAKEAETENATETNEIETEEAALRRASETEETEAKVEKTSEEAEAEDNEEETVAEEDNEEKANDDEESSEADLVQLDRVAYEAQFQEAPNDLAVLMQEEFQLTQFIDSSGLQLYGSVPSIEAISRRLSQLAEQTGKRSAFINISLQSNQLESFAVLPDRTLAGRSNPKVASSDLNVIDARPKNTIVRKTVKDTSRKDLMEIATQFREGISDLGRANETAYLSSAQELYRVLIEPLEAELEANDIDILVFSLDSGLRLLPVAALHDGEQFLVEKYAMGIVPSFGLTDTRYVNLNQSSILAMGASKFEEQPSLPTMPIELKTILRSPRHGESYLNEQFTIDNFIAQNSRETPFSIVHLGTHAEFKAGDLNNSYIQFYNEKLKMPQLQELSDRLGWNTDATPVELLVLSACETALGDEEAELGFAGLAVQAGAKSALASLWYVSDLGTLALMGEFYDQLGDSLVKAEALRQTQLQMIQGKVKIDNRQVELSNGERLDLPKDFPAGTLSLSHPYYWSAFTLIGNWN